MILVEQTQVAEADLPVQAFREHLQLGTGFAEDGVQDPVLVTALRAAIAAIEGRTGKALIARDFLLVTNAWRDPHGQVFPVAPVQSITRFEIEDLSGELEAIDTARVTLRRDAHAPCMEAVGLGLPTIPVGGSANIAFRAGFGTWADVPEDLKQAVLLMGAHFHDNRAAATERARALPMGVDALCRRHTPVRIVGARRL